MRLAVRISGLARTQAPPALARLREQLRTPRISRPVGSNSTNRSRDEE